MNNEDREELIGICAAAAERLLHPPPGDADAEREYVRLFLSPQGALCPPWQSIYMAEEGETPRLMGPAHHGALAWYRRFGFEPAIESEPADHAGLLLLFYAHLLQSDAGDEDLAGFSAAHLNWLSRLAARLRASTSDPAYLEVAAALDAVSGYSGA